jgi:hypothetical protein
MFGMGTQKTLWIILLCPLLMAPALADGKLTLEDIFTLKELGYTDAQIVAEIERTGTRIHVLADEIDRLKKAGIGETVIAALRGKEKTEKPKEGERRTPPTPETTPIPGGTPGGTPGDTPAVGGGSDLKSELTAAYGASAAVVAYGETYVKYGVQAALGASRLASGTRLVTTGTLTQKQAGAMDFAYSATPEDRLRVVLADGKTVDYVISDMQGDLRGDFLASDHSLSLRVIAKGELDLQFTTRRARQSKAHGHVVEDGRKIGVAEITTDNVNFHFVIRTGAERVELQRWQIRY